jgi:hypothetical protein
VRDFPGRFEPLRQDRELDVLRDSLIGERALFMLPGLFCLVTPEGAICERFGSRDEVSCNYFAFGLNLEDSSIRRALNGCVLLAPYVYGMLNDLAVRPERDDIEMSRDTYRLIFGSGGTSSRLQSCADAILDLADTYRTSIMPASELAYCGVPLQFSFSQATYSRARESRVADASDDKDIRYFYDDYIELTSYIAELVSQHQFKQLDQGLFVQKSMRILTKPIHYRDT